MTPFFWKMLKLEREKAPFLEEAPGKLEPRWQSTKVKLVKVKLVSWEKLSSCHSPLGGSGLKLSPTREEGKASQAKRRSGKL